MEMGGYLWCGGGTIVKLILSFTTDAFSIHMSTSSHKEMLAKAPHCNGLVCFPAGGTRVCPICKVFIRGDMPRHMKGNHGLRANPSKNFSKNGVSMRVYEYINIRDHLATTEQTHDSSHHGAIYLAQELEDVNQEIYKIGRTAQAGFKRFKQYPRGTDVILYLRSQDCVRDEGILIELFKENYKLARGREYFRGSMTEMKKDIFRIVNQGE